MGAIPFTSTFFTTGLAGKIFQSGIKAPRKAKLKKRDVYMKLLIVESPSKSKTIENYLGSDYKVLSSKGHVRDLSTHGTYGLGVNIEDDFNMISFTLKNLVNENKINKLYIHG